MDKGHNGAEAMTRLMKYWSTRVLNVARELVKAEEEHERAKTKWLRTFEKACEAIEREAIHEDARRAERLAQEKPTSAVQTERK